MSGAARTLGLISHVYPHEKKREAPLWSLAGGKGHQGLKWSREAGRRTCAGPYRGGIQVTMEEPGEDKAIALAPRRSSHHMSGAIG